MKKSVITHTILHVLIASLLTLVLYIALYFILGAVFNSMSNETFKLNLISFITLSLYAYVLFCIVKKRNDTGTDEVIDDYRNEPYVSLFNDIKVIIRRDKRYIITVSSVILISYALNKFDSLVFGKKVISIIVFPFTPMSIFATCFRIEIFGYLFSIATITVMYIFFVALYRRKQYRVWVKSPEGRNTKCH